MRNKITKYLTHHVDIIKVTMTKGVRTTSIIPNQKAFISNGEKVIVDALGSHLIKFTKIYMEHDANVSLGDELSFERRSRPVRSVLKSHDPLGIHHLEVEVE